MYSLAKMPQIDANKINSTVTNLLSRNFTADEQAIRFLISVLDLTSLTGNETQKQIRDLCERAQFPIKNDPIQTAAICVFPPFVSLAKETLHKTSIKIAAVESCFPSGKQQIDQRVDSVRKTVEAGADEIDIVIQRDIFLAGEYAQTFDEIAALREACGSAHLKVILETGELKTFENVRLASQIAIDAGAHFIKTSTGKNQPAATLPMTLVMLKAIKDHFNSTGKMVGIKPAGGIRSVKDALQYQTLIKEELGEAWFSKQWFRLGVSSLLKNLLAQL